MEQRKFYQPDILSHLAEIVQKNTRAYTADFDFDAKRLLDSAQESDKQKKCAPTWDAFQLDYTFLYAVIFFQFSGNPISRSRSVPAN